MATLKDLSDRLSGTESAIFELINNLAGVVDSSQTDIEENEERLFAMAKIVKRLLAEFRLSTSLVPDTAGSSGQANDQAAMVDVLASVYDEDANSDPVSTRRARREKDREVLHGALNLPNGGIFKEMKALHRAYCRMVLEYKRLGQKHFSTQIRRNVGNDDHETHKNREPDVRDSIEKAEELFARFTENTPASSSSPLKIAEESPVCTSSPFKFVEDNLLYSSFPFKITEDGSVHSSAPFKNAEGKFTTSSSTDNQHRDKQGDKFITRVETMKLFNGLSLRHQAELQRLRADLAALKSTSGMLKPPESVYAGTVFDSKSIALPATEMKGRAFRSNCSSSQESAGTGKRTPATHREGVVDSGPSELSVSSQRSSYSSWKDPSGSFASFQDEQDAFMEKKLLDINVEVFKSPKKGSLGNTFNYLK
jgi:hypothetical protein